MGLPRLMEARRRPCGASACSRSFESVMLMIGPVGRDSTCLKVTVLSNRKCTHGVGSRKVMRGLPRIDVALEGFANAAALPDAIPFPQRQNPICMLGRWGFGGISA